ncbi:hypothetical protein TMatcc_006424 [Talaromyces marneffei ATCC 18224]
MSSVLSSFEKGICEDKDKVIPYTAAVPPPSPPDTQPSPTPQLPRYTAATTLSQPPCLDGLDA